MHLITGANRRIKREHNLAMKAAWYAGSMQLFKKPPRLADLMADLDDTPRRQTWQEIKAALMFAMPPKKAGKNGQ